VRYLIREGECSVSIFQDILHELNTGKKVVLVTELSATNKSRAYYTDENLEASGINELIIKAFETGQIQVVEGPEQKLTIVEPFFPQHKMIVLGAGHIAKPLVEFAAKVGFAVTVADDRFSFANKERFPDAEEVICESFDKCFDMLQFHPYTYVVVVTRGHRHDLSCLRQVLQKQWAYAGMIGSRRRVKVIKQQLLNEGFSQEMLDKINAPIGMEIGAVTPEEIAISILGEVISYRRLQNPKLGRESAKIDWTEFDRDVIEELAQDKKDKKALVTIYHTGGSVPRRAGAKMLVWPDGRILGSIGGGCSESRVMQTAYDVIQNGGYKLQRIDLTDEVAEEEGMVCGGMMKVVVESC